MDARLRINRRTSIFKTRQENCIFQPRKPANFRWYKMRLQRLSSHILCIVFLFCIICYENICHNATISVKVFHYMVPHWGVSYVGDQACNSTIYSCHWYHSDKMKELKEFYEVNIVENAISLSLYNVHSYWEKIRSHRPSICDLPTNLTMVETEESKIRYGYLFEPTFKHFDGVSSTSPASDVQRVYREAFLEEVNSSTPIHNFTSLIKAASYVASDCHRRDAANANRDHVVHMIRQAGFRVDGLGKCMHSIGPDGVHLPNNPESRYSLDIKRDVISRYMFNCAFENSLEQGYVTEKPFDALIAGLLLFIMWSH